MAKKVETLIAQEFSFVQELVWLPPCRNPFPRCTEKKQNRLVEFDRVLSDYGKLEVLYKRLLSSLKSEKDDQKQPDTNVRSTYRKLKALVDRAAAILESDAKPLIKFRRSFCKRVVLITSINYTAEFSDLEREADSLITQYLERARGLTTKHINSIEKWTKSIKPIQFSQLEAAFQKRFCSFIGSVNIDVQECRENMESLPNGENLAEEDGADLTNLYSGDHNMVSNIFDMPSPTDITCQHQYEKAEKKNRTVKNRNLHLEMTMKAILCPGLHTTKPEENCWHVIFGLVNRDQCAVAVQSLSYWSLNDAHHHHQHGENSSRSDPEVYTIKWPKGGVILKESPAFLCYGCQIHCRSFSDSPRVVYSWQYRAVPQRPNYSAITRGNNIGAVGGQYLKRSTKFATIQDGVIGTDNTSSGDVEVASKATSPDDDRWRTSILISEEGSTKDEDNNEILTDQSEDEFQSRIGRSTAERDYNPLYKRLGSLIWSRLGNPLKKVKVDSDGDGDGE